MKKVTAVIVILVMLAAVLFGCGKNPETIDFDNAVNIYVSPNGSDDGDGSAENPVATITRAQELVRKYSSKSDVCVNINTGTYIIDDTIKFTSEDGGKNGHSVMYLGERLDFASGNVVLSGGKSIDGWKLFDKDNNIYKAENIDFDFAQLYVDGNKAVRAISTPIDDKYSTRIIKAYREETTENGVTYPANSITLDKALIGEWSNIKDIKLKILMAWTDNTLPIESIDYIGGRAVIKVQEPCASRLFNRPHPDVTGYAGVEQFVCYFENAYEFIDEDNEWYLDKNSSTLYYKAPKDLDILNASVIAPKAETLISIEGTEKNPVKNLFFQNITFSHTSWTRANEEGLVGGQASQYVLTSNLDNEIGVYRTPSAVSASWTDNVCFIGNTFKNIGATALDYYQGNRGGIVEGNTFCDISGNGINIGKFVCDDLHDFHDAYNPENKKEICDGQVIRNNYITRVGTDYEGAVGIAGGYPENLTIEHNTLSSMPYTAISVGYGWTSEKNAMKGNKIRYNHIHDVCLAVCDGAAVYTLSKQPNSEISYNFIHDFARRSWFDYDCAGIYLDEQTSGYNIHDNVMLSCPGVWEHNTGKNKLEHNGEIYDEELINESGVTGDYIGILPDDELPIMPNAPLDESEWSATAFNTNDGSSPAEALDMNSDTRWISGADQEVGSWFELDMKEINFISKIAFLGSIGDNPDFPSDCDIMVSSDANEWITVARIRDNDNVAIEAEFEKASARYIKIVVTKERAAWWDIRTIKVYN